MTKISVQSHDGGTFEAYCAMPPSGTGPGLILLQEAFGVTQFLRDAADRYAAQGYIVLAPDMYWRIEPGVELTDADFNRAMEMIGQFDSELADEDMRSTVKALRAIPGFSGGVGAVGYCLGGRLAAAAASHGDVDCAIVYYGVGVVGYLDGLDKAGVPVSFHYGTGDKHCEPEIEPIRALVERHETMDLALYEGADHAFANQYRKLFDADAAALAESRALAKLASVIGPK